jgi:hypothetical protein
MGISTNAVCWTLESHWVASGAPATLIAGRSANESLESLGAIQDVSGPDDIYRSILPRLDCDIFLDVATKARRFGIDCRPRWAPKRFQLYSGVPSVSPRP